jgi:hypothetical protein
MMALFPINQNRSRHTPASGPFRFSKAEILELQQIMEGILEVVYALLRLVSSLLGPIAFLSSNQYFDEKDRLKVLWNPFSIFYIFLNILNMWCLYTVGRSARWSCLLKDNGGLQCRRHSNLPVIYEALRIIVFTLWYKAGSIISGFYRRMPYLLWLFLLLQSFNSVQKISDSTIARVTPVCLLESFGFDGFPHLFALVRGLVGSILCFCVWRFAANAHRGFHSFYASGVVLFTAISIASFRW